MPTKVDISALASELRVVIGQLVRRLRAQQPFSLTQMAVLKRLDAGDPVSVSDLAAAEHVRPQSMAQTVGDLEADGLVAREPDPRDRRRALVRLTGAGRTAIEDQRRRRDDWLAQAMERELSAEEREALERALPLLRRLVES
jgi:DNA-binding MarR family transcriptional regulator